MLRGLAGAAELRTATDRAAKKGIKEEECVPQQIKSQKGAG